MDMEFRTLNLMPNLREQAQEHPDFEVLEDGSVQLKEGVEYAELESDRVEL